MQLNLLYIDERENLQSLLPQPFSYKIPLECGNVSFLMAQRERKLERTCKRIYEADSMPSKGAIDQ
jgi:hypothetical protein